MQRDCGGNLGRVNDMHKETTASAVEVLKDAVAGGCGSKSGHVCADSQKIPESGRANGRKT